LLHSYQQGPEWVQNITDGVLSVFSRNPDFTYIRRFEYMNVLDADPASYPEIYRKRLGRQRFDIVIGVDNQSLEFLVGHRSELFPGVPIVFCSVDDYTPALLEGETGITGVTGELDFAGTIRLARSLHPGMRHLLVLGNRDLAAESAAYAELLELTRAGLNGEIRIEYWEDPKLSEVIARAGSFPADTVVFDMAFLLDDAGRLLSIPSSTRQASEALNLPIYSCWETILGAGIVGGMISGGYQQGEAAGELAVAILRGADPDSLPVVQKGTNRPMFDYEQLQRFRIPERKLPEGSIVINRPSSLYARYRNAIWATAVIVAGLLVLLVLSWRTQAKLGRGYQTLDRRVQDRTRELAVLNSLAAVVSRSLDLGEIMRAALEKTMEATGMEAGAAYRLEEPAQTLVVMAHRGLSELFVSRTSRLPIETALAGKQLTLDQPVNWSMTEYPGGELKRQIQEEGLELVIGVPVTAKGRMLGGLVISTRRPRSLTPEESSLLTAIGRQIGLAVENARLFELERAKHEEAERRRVVAEGLREILAVLNSNRPLQDTLDSIIRQTCRVTGSDAASLLQRGPSDGPFTIQSSCGLDPDYVSAIRFSPGKGGAGRALAARQPVVLGDAAAFVDQMRREPDPEYEEEKRALELMIGRGFSALLAVPLIIQEEDYGGITLYYRRAREFSKEEIQLAQSVADQAALAIENARLRSQAEQAAAYAERSRLARELHDSVTQSLYSITLYAEAVARMLTAGGGAEVAEHMRELRATAQEALREMRLLIYQLSPPVLEEAGLAGALQKRLDSVEARGGVNAALQVEGSEHLPPLVRKELYQIAQEALNNSLKHARARSVRVVLDFQESLTRLEVCDDGSGFEPEAAQRGGGLGLRGMRERAEAIGATLRVDSAPGKGTKVSVVVPAAPS
jgi:signal transduction histidine kinase/ABC-type uncharacterized transport system substrate-binding protein